MSPKHHHVKLAIILAFAVLSAYFIKQTKPAEAIIGGNEVPDYEAVGQGMVKVGVYNGGRCSGILLTKDWVLTCNHGGFRNEKPEKIEVLLGNGRLDPGTQFYGSVADFVVGHPSLDALLIHLKTPLPPNGKINERGFFTDANNKLKRMDFVSYGYGGSGNLSKANSTQTGKIEEALFQTKFAKGSVPTGGDSGGPLLTAGKAEPAVIAGVLKGGGQWGSPFYTLPSIFRDWAISYMYNRPIDLPKVWFAYNTAQCLNNGYCGLWETPIQNDFTNEWTFDPCPGGNYSWSATYDLEPNQDYIYIINKYYTATLNGYNGAQTGAGSGPLTLKVKTNATVQSPGLKTMKYTCENKVFTDPLVEKYQTNFPNPLPTNFNERASIFPCVDNEPGNNGYTVSGTYQFADGDYGIIQYATTNNQTVQKQLIGTGNYTGYVQWGNVSLRAITHSEVASTTSSTLGSSSSTPKQADTKSKSTGFGEVSATCDAKIICHGPQCFTIPEKIGKHQGTHTKFWDPCSGGVFKWRATYDMPVDHGTITVQPTVSLGTTTDITTFTGSGSTNWLKGKGKQLITVTTDGQATGDGLTALDAVCKDW